MMPILIPGVPAPKGSTKAYVVAGRARVTDDNDATKPWQAQVSAFVAEAAGPTVVFPRPIPIRLTLVFVMPRPAGELKRSTRPHTRKPDVDKLQRSVLDALTGLVYEDDAQVTWVSVHKRTARPGERPGLWISWEEAR